jgi:hypothetical protein
MIEQPTMTGLVSLAWDDLVSLHQHLEQNPKLQTVPAFILELDEAHGRYVKVYSQWARGGK